MSPENLNVRMICFFIADSHNIIFNGGRGSGTGMRQVPYWQSMHMLCRHCSASRYRRRGRTAMLIKLPASRKSYCDFLHLLLEIVRTNCIFMKRFH
jgi:hypothetical protein